MSQHNCSKDGPTSQPHLRTLPPPGDSQERSDSPEICHYEKSFHNRAAAPNYTHCGLFGDPHLRTFTDRFQTCKVQGAWPLIDNNYLNVQVGHICSKSVVSAPAEVSRRLKIGHPGNQLTIIFKNFQECVDQKTAVAKCKEKLPVEDLYYQACVFDLLTTGDVNFTLAAYYALEDVKMLHSNKDKLHLYARTREPPGQAGAAPGPPPAPWPLLGTLLLLALLPALPGAA
ncbi:hypothetical protein Celaphus_00015168 [Cervus elaphus hippelaphus]|uniref:Repulsive guidance molecule C-terminal domain-containing protein n=1 Tax=Cervus elaphus hippelaphus TaxID=46360 RepID=A0A212CSW0_CEREH|nr:hypothetical protein Celaphus_00015168 [Cervus elaphus hippelaphus]